MQWSLEHKETAHRSSFGGYTHIVLSRLVTSQYILTYGTQPLRAAPILDHRKVHTTSCHSEPCTRYQEDLSGGVQPDLFYTLPVILSSRVGGFSNRQRPSPVTA